jgi:hypothetical protein
MEKLSAHKFHTLEKYQQKNIFGGVEDTQRHCAELQVLSDGRTVTNHEISMDNGTLVTAYSTLGNTTGQTRL